MAQAKVLFEVHTARRAIRLQIWGPKDELELWIDGQLVWNERWGRDEIVRINAAIEKEKTNGSV